MKKTLLSSMFVIALLCVHGSVFKQARPSPKSSSEAFCTNDRRFVTRVYCRDLAAFQDAVNSGSATTPDNASKYLNKLDLRNPDAIFAFITAAATNIALSNALHDADQSRLDQQVGTNSNSNGATSLVSRAGSAELLALARDTGALTKSVNGTTATLAPRTLTRFSAS